MSLQTISGAPVTTVEAGSTFTVAVETISGPDTTFTPVTTRYVYNDDRTTDVYTSYTPNAAAPGGYAPTIITETPRVSKPTSETTKSDTSKPDTKDTEASTKTIQTSSRTTETESTTAGTSVEPTTTTASAAEIASRPLPTAAAPTNANNSSPAIESPSNRGPSISNGALAGAIVGSIVGTALVVLLLAFLFFRRRRNQPSKEYGLEPIAVLPKNSSSHDNSGKADAFTLASVNPQPADDDTVRTRILAVIDQASLHVDNYYAPGSTPIQLTHEQVAPLERFNTGQLPAPIVTLLAQRSVQRQLITHVLVYSLLRRIELGGELIPRELATQPQSSQPNAPDPIKGLFTWRMLTAHLYANSSFTSGTGTDPTATNGAALAKEFTEAFEPYSIPTSSPTERIAHLESLTRLTTNLGIWLFGQPCGVEFVWNVEKKGRDEFLVSPRVVKVSDERGDKLAETLVLVEGVKARG